MCRNNLDTLLGLPEAGDVYIEQVNISQHPKDPFMSIMHPQSGVPQHMMTDQYCDVNIIFRCTSAQAKKILDTLEAGQTCVF